MNSIQSVFVALCLWCTPATATINSHASLECYKSPQQLHKVYPGEPWKRHKTPDGRCYHIGPSNHSGMWNHMHSSTTKNVAKANFKSHQTITSVSGTARWKVPSEFRVYPEPGWPKLYGIDRTKEFQDYSKPTKYPGIFLGVRSYGP